MSATDDSRELLNITGGSPVVAECPPTEPITPVAMVQIVPPADPTILEVVTLNTKIWDQTKSNQIKSNQIKLYSATDIHVQSYIYIYIYTDYM